MSEATIQNLLALCESIDRHSETVMQQMSQAGMKPDMLVADSVAKYWNALEKLAAE